LGVRVPPGAQNEVLESLAETRDTRAAQSLGVSRSPGPRVPPVGRVIPRLADCGLEKSRARLEELDLFAQAVEFDDPNLVEIRKEVFALGGDEEEDWNNYHRVRSKYDCRAAEEFDLGQ